MHVQGGSRREIFGHHRTIIQGHSRRVLNIGSKLYTSVLLIKRQRLMDGWCQARGYNLGVAAKHSLAIVSMQCYWMCEYLIVISNHIITKSSSEVDDGLEHHLIWV